MARDLNPELRDEDRPAVVEKRVEPLEDALRREVPNVEDQPVALLHLAEDDAVAPVKPPVAPSSRRSLPKRSLMSVCSLRLTRVGGCEDGGERLDHRRLADARRALEEDRLWELQRAEEPQDVDGGSQGSRRRRGGSAR